MASAELALVTRDGAAINSVMYSISKGSTVIQSDSVTVQQSE